jgi:hypothetical protein
MNESSPRGTLLRVHIAVAREELEGVLVLDLVMLACV